MSAKTSCYSLPQSSNLRRGNAETRKFETFDKHAQKEGAGDSGNCKTTSALTSTFIMSTLNVTPFGNRPARRACLLEYSGNSLFSRIPNPLLSHGAFAGILEIPGRRIPFGSANRFLSSDFL